MGACWAEISYSRVTLNLVLRNVHGVLEFPALLILAQLVIGDRTRTIRDGGYIIYGFGGSSNIPNVNDLLDFHNFTCKGTIIITSRIPARGGGSSASTLRGYAFNELGCMGHKDQECLWAAAPRLQNE